MPRKASETKRKRKRKSPKDGPCSMYWCDKADEVWKMLVRTNADFACAICGLKSQLIHSHHFIGRSRKFYRHNLENGICLCAQHHLFNPHLSAHLAAWAFEAKVKEMYPDRHAWWAKNRYETHGGITINFKEIYEDLLEQLEEAEE